MAGAPLWRSADGSARRRAWWSLGLAALVGTVVMVTAYVRWESRCGPRSGSTASHRGRGLDAADRRRLFVVVSWLWRAASRRPDGSSAASSAGSSRPVATVVGGLVVAVVAYVLVTGVATNRLLVTLTRRSWRSTTSSPPTCPRPPVPSSRAARGPTCPGRTSAVRAGSSSRTHRRARRSRHSPASRPRHRSGPTSGSVPTATSTCPRRPRGRSPSSTGWVASGGRC